MADSAAQPERSKPSTPAKKSSGKPAGKVGAKPAGKGPKKPRLVGDPNPNMTAFFNWGASSVTVTFPAEDLYPDNTSQQWTFAGTLRNESATTRSDTFTSFSNTGNTMTVVQIRPSGNFTFHATDINRGDSSSTLYKQ